MAASLAERVMSKVLVTGGCWEWQAYRNPKGYGTIRVGPTHKLAHRVVYELLVGPIPEGLEIDHLCRNTCCVNPEHLEPVTSAENRRRGLGVEPAAEMRRAMTHCKRGHEFTDDNLRITSQGFRACKKCAALHQRDYRRRMAERS